VTCDRSVVSSINNTDRHDINEILLKVALNTIKRMVFKFSRKILAFSETGSSDFDLWAEVV
jgi:hypothetical protein